MAKVTRKAVVKDVLQQMKAQDQVVTVDDIDRIIKAMDTVFDKYDVTEQRTDNDDRAPVEVREANMHVLDEFINSKVIEGKSDTTIYNYRNEIEKCFEFLNKHYTEITSQDIRAYMQYRKDKCGLKSSSVQNIRMYLKSFYKFLMREEYVKSNPMDKIDVIKTEQKVIDTLTDEEAEIIRCSCSCERDLAIVDLLSGSAMRVSEMCALNKQDVNFQTREIIVYGKGKKERTCFMTGRAKVHLMWYLEERTDDNEALFVTTKKPYNRLTKNGVEYILRNIAKSSKIPTRRLYPHLYRKTVASNMLSRGADPATIQNILGHKSVDTTLSVYCKVDKENIKHEHAKYIN